MVAPVVVSEMVTVCAEVYVPATGEKVGVATVLLMVYTAVALSCLCNQWQLQWPQSSQSRLQRWQRCTWSSQVVGVVPLVV